MGVCIYYVPSIGLFEWDEAKAGSNLEKHGLDFPGAVRIFETQAILRVHSEREGEDRWNERQAYHEAVARRAEGG